MGSKILNIIKKIEEGILFLFLAVILLACFFQVIGRYTPLPFSSAFEEIAVNPFYLDDTFGGWCMRANSLPYAYGHYRYLFTGKDKTLCRHDT